MDTERAVSVTAGLFQCWHRYSDEYTIFGELAQCLTNHILCWFFWQVKCRYNSFIAASFSVDTTCLNGLYAHFPPQTCEFIAILMSKLRNPRYAVLPFPVRWQMPSMAQLGDTWHVTRGTGTAGADCIHDNGNGGHDKEASLIRGAWYQSYNADKYDDILLRLSLYLHYIHHMEYDPLVWVPLKLQTA